MLVIEEFWVILVICFALFHCLQNLNFLKFLTSSIHSDGKCIFNLELPFGLDFNSSWD
jgi:hypothetical protein